MLVFFQSKKSVQAEHLNLIRLSHSTLGSVIKTPVFRSVGNKMQL